jgi:hypothetical protein
MAAQRRARESTQTPANQPRDQSSRTAQARQVAEEYANDLGEIIKKLLRSISN